MKALLAASAEDVPPDPVSGRARVLRALELGASGPVEVGSPPPSRSRRAWPSVAMFAIAGLLVASAASFSASRREASPPPADASRALDEGASTRAAASVTEPNRADAPVPEPLLSVDVHSLASAPPGDGVEPDRPRRADVRRDIHEPTRPSSLERTAPTPTRDAADELQMLERAQRAASQGRPEEALALVARHRREFPRGRFVVEMKVAEIEALARAGRVGEAAARGARFLEDHPGSPYTRRVEAVVRLQDKREQAR